ncbi:hypothetical protein N9937_01140 [bacterium]|nr:hypothetical protein [bacterium]
MPSIAKLVVSLGAETASFETDMKRAARNQERRMKQMKASAIESGRALATAFAGAAVAMTAVVASAAKTADGMQKLALRTGISTDALSKYSYAAGQTGSSFETLNKGITRMQRSLSDAEAGLSTQVRAFDRIGIAVEDLQKLSPDKQFEKIGFAIAGLESATSRAATAQEIFGRAGAELLPLFAAGAEGMQVFSDKAERFGVIIGQEFADNAAKFNDNLDDMGQLVKGAGLSFTESLLPALLGVQNAMLDNATSMSTFGLAGEKVGEVVIYLTRAFTILWGILRTITAALVGMAVTVMNAFAAILEPIQATITGLAEAAKALASGDFKGAMDAVKNIGQESAGVFNRALDGMKNGIDEVRGSTIYFNQAMEKSGKITASTADQVESTADSFGDLSNAASVAGQRLEKLRAAYGAKQQQRDYKTRLDGINDSLQESYEILEQLTAEQDAYESSLKSLLDTLYPVEAAGREFGDALNILTEAYETGDISLARYQQSVAKLTERFDGQVGSIRGVKKEFDALQTALDEGVRILERTFTGIWDSLLDGSGEAFEAIKDGFRSMLGNIANQAITQPIIVNIQNGMQGTGTGPNGGINFQQLGTDLAAFGAVIAGTALGGGGAAAATGATIGAIVGQIAIPIPVLGAAIGAALGGLLGGLFDKSGTPRISAGTSDVMPGDSRFFRTDFGGVSLGDTRGNMDEAVEQWGRAIQNFDNSLADFLNDDQITAVTTSLEDWATTLKGDAITIEQLLNRRFAAVMTTFSESVRDFVSDGEDLAEKIERLQVGVGAENLIASQPELFGDVGLDGFLTVVEAFKNGNETIVEAYNEVLLLLNIIGTAYKSLEAFRDSNLGDDFADVLFGMNATLQEALSGMVSGLDDAMRNFDGSPEELQRIAAIVSSVREGEIKLLVQIDSIQQGISSNLAKLKSDLLGISKGPQTGEQLFNKAAGLIGSLGSASTAQEVADIARQFEATVRQMSPEDQARNAGELVRMVEDFDTTQKAVLEGMKQAVLDSGAETRAMVEGFIERVGTPLDLLVGSNQEVAEALGDGGAFEQMTIDNGTHQGNVEGILEVGVGDIAAEVNNIGPVVASALQNALRGTDINVQVVVNGGLVTQ